MDPELVRAIVTACLAKSPDWARRQLASNDEAKRIRAEDVLAAMIVVALDEVTQTSRTIDPVAEDPQYTLDRAVSLDHSRKNRPK